MGTGRDVCEGLVGMAMKPDAERPVQGTVDGTNVSARESSADPWRVETPDEGDWIFFASQPIRPRLRRLNLLDGQRLGIVITEDALEHYRCGSRRWLPLRVDGMHLSFNLVQDVANVMNEFLYIGCAVFWSRFGHAEAST